MISFPQSKTTNSKWNCKQFSLQNESFPNVYQTNWRAKNKTRENKQNRIEKLSKQPSVLELHCYLEQVRFIEIQLHLYFTVMSLLEKLQAIEQPLYIFSRFPCVCLNKTELSNIVAMLSIGIWGEFVQTDVSNVGRYSKPPGMRYAWYKLLLLIHAIYGLRNAANDVINSCFIAIQVCHTAN